MIKENVRLKNDAEITLDDIARMSEMIVHYIVGRDENNQPFYRPYNRNSAKTMAIAICLVTGYEIEDDEDVYDVIMGDPDIMTCVKNATGLAQYRDMVAKVDSMVDDMLEFEKKSVIHNSPETNKLVVEILTMQKQFEQLRIDALKNQNRLLDQQIETGMKSQEALDKLSPETMTKLMEKFAGDDFDLEALSESIVKKYLESEYHKEMQEGINEATVS